MRLVAISFLYLLFLHNSRYFDKVNMLYYLHIERLFISQKEGITVYTVEELTRARRAITLLAKRNNVPEEQVRSDLREAINNSFRSTDPNVQAQWAVCEFAGSEPTPEEFIIWISEKVYARLGK